MNHMRFGAFLAPHHPIGENPMLQLQSDLEFVQHLDNLGFDEFWCGEHHSTGWEVIASPELFLAAAAERTQRIKLGTGVISLPYHHPFMVAQRLVQLDYQSRGRVIFGSGPGALPSDAHTLGLDPMLLRSRQDEAIGIIKRLFSGERFSYESEWFTLRDAKLQLRPLQENMEFVVASTFTPSGMTLSGKYETGVISIGGMASQGLKSLARQWEFAEESALKHGTAIDRKNWRILMSWHIAESRDQAREEAKDGLLIHNNEYTTRALRPDDGQIFKTADEAVDAVAFSGVGNAVIGTPDDLINKIQEMIDVTGGFGAVIGFAHDWANRENTKKSWDLVARYVIPEINSMLADYRDSIEFVVNNRETWKRATDARLSNVAEHESAAKVMQTEGLEGEKSKS
ncbi:MAG: LLM class flavin-dependent oxidoreductase [SAR202 cluster bacterium]|nr:MAG: LLM class flavin-dependent oxidoreductase [SAR202 cluster bacterium]MEC7733477.1 LLM class flavin-dependent oxidoreductase [Chloroflexota bacterium]MED5409099.1 LLM class flavin-dependent oxidoreductase [Chloroflexota bacterium]MED5449800.1 LLM class flavin-dependent oxidoreductase [Chloroflexota bacterium]